MSIFEGFLSTPEAIEAFGDAQFVAAMLRFESALARAQARAGLIPEAAAQTIADTCKVDLFDVPQIVRDSGRAGSVAIPLVAKLKENVALFNASAVQHVHFGSTSQDVIDTAMALVSKQGLRLIEADLIRAIDALFTLAEKHAATPILARTLMQPASVTSFGLKCVNWVAPLVRSLLRLRAASSAALAVQLGGAVGTLSTLNGAGAQVVQSMSEELGLAAHSSAWHTQRDQWLALACELALMVGSLGKIGQDIALMGQFEVGELAEPTEAGRGGSTAMPHKRNPVASMTAKAAAQRAPQRLAALLATMPHEHERALGAWQAELAEWPGLMVTAHGSVRAMATALEGLQVFEARMRGNIDNLVAQVPEQTAQEWFSVDLAQNAARITLAQVKELKGLRASYE
jgi:3-carboxy-cis,cis-muconate cycloisomerase